MAYEDFVRGYTGIEGPDWLLVLLTCACYYFGAIRWPTRSSRHRDDVRKLIGDY